MVPVPIIERAAAPKPPPVVPPAVVEMADALQSFVDACGGSPPDWLEEEYDAAEDALDAYKAWRRSLRATS